MKIGGRDVIHTSSIIVPKDEDAWVTFNVGDWNINLKIFFTVDKEKENNMLSLDVVDGNPQLNLINWKGSFGAATKKPLELGKTKDGLQISFMLCHWLVGKTNKIDIQFLLGGEYDTFT